MNQDETMQRVLQEANKLIMSTSEFKSMPSTAWHRIVTASLKIDSVLAAMKRPERTEP